VATRTRKTKAAAGPQPEVRPLGSEEVARRAYEIYESDDGGDPVENWLRAERELLAQSAAS
jgi:Protein of unknown function (DUF2934)